MEHSETDMRANGRIKAILFDFGGTLDSDGLHWWQRLYEDVCNLDGSITQAEFFVFTDQAATQITALPDTKTLTMAATVERLCLHTHRAIIADRTQSAVPWHPVRISQRFVAESEAVIERNRPVLQQLRQTYRLGCISNNWGNAAGWCNDYGLNDYFETVIDSTVVGSIKPDGVIFQAALDQLQLPAEACAYVGDRYDCDVLGANAAGMLPIWITGDCDCQQTDDSVKPYRIRTLADLLTAELP